MAKLLVGLGNPGKDYENTRHNVGFFILDGLARKWGVSLDRQKYEGFYGEYFSPPGEKVLLVKPQTYMNLSGQCVWKWVKFLKISGEDILVIHDELDLALGKFKAQWAAGPAGHNGVRSIIDNLGHKEFNRLRVGVGHPGSSKGVTNHVLSPFRKEEVEQVERVVEKGVEAVELFLKMGLDPVSQLVNKKDSLGPPKDASS